MELNRYDVYTILKERLSLEDILILDWLETNIESKRCNIQIGKDGKNYHIVPVNIITAECNDIKCMPDNVLRRLKNLDKSGFVNIQMGRWTDNKFGYTRTAFRLTRKYQNLLKK